MNMATLPTLGSIDIIWAIIILAGAIYVLYAMEEGKPLVLKT